MRGWLVPHHREREFIALRIWNGFYREFSIIQKLSSLPTRRTLICFHVCEAIFDFLFYSQGCNNTNLLLLQSLFLERIFLPRKLKKKSYERTAIMPNLNARINQSLMNERERKRRRWSSHKRGFLTPTIISGNNGTKNHFLSLAVV